MHFPSTWPVYHDSDISVGISTESETEGIIDPFKKSWSPTSSILVDVTSTWRPRSAAASRYPGSPTLILCLSSKHTKAVN